MISGIEYNYYKIQVYLCTLDWLHGCIYGFWKVAWRSSTTDGKTPHFENCHFFLDSIWAKAEKHRVDWIRRKKSVNALQNQQNVSYVQILLSPMVFVVFLFTRLCCVSVTPSSSKLCFELRVTVGQHQSSALVQVSMAQCLVSKGAEKSVPPSYWKVHQFLCVSV